MDRMSYVFLEQVYTLTERKHYFMIAAQDTMNSETRAIRVGVKRKFQGVHSAVNTIPLSNDHSRTRRL